MRPIALVLLLALFTALAPGVSPVRADGWRGDGTEGHGEREWEDEDRSHDRARRAAERGEILPLSTIYERALAELPGRVLEAELEREHGDWIYELKILDPQGRLLDVYVDARSGRVLGDRDER